jgi:hypothetical protein
MKSLKKLAVVAGIGVSINAVADINLWVTYPGYCNVKKLYLNSYLDIYGYEVGCFSSYGRPLVGSYDSGSGNAWISSTDDSGLPVMNVYRYDGLLKGAQTNSTGTSIYYGQTITYRVSTTSPVMAVTQSVSPNVSNSTKQLPDLGF